MRAEGKISDLGFRIADLKAKEAWGRGKKFRNVDCGLKQGVRCQTGCWKVGMME